MSVSRYFFRVSAGAPTHPKLVRLGDVHGRDGLAAIGLWALAGAVAARTEPPGTIGDADLRRLHVGDRRGAQLVDLLAHAGLLDPLEGGWAIHGFGKANRTGGHRRAARRATREGGGEP